MFVLNVKVNTIVTLQKWQTSAQNARIFCMTMKIAIITLRMEDASSVFGTAMFQST